MPSENKDDLEDRIKAARDEFEEDYNPKPVENQHTRGANIGYEFLAYVISGGLVGYLVDHFAGTAPWGILGGFILGLIGGVYRADRRMKQKL
ncbi:MAG: AtpZ/AtpI family protein [Pseudomonadota bacterium]